MQTLHVVTVPYLDIMPSVLGNRFYLAQGQETPFNSNGDNFRQSKTKCGSDKSAGDKSCREAEVLRLET